MLCAAPCHLHLLVRVAASLCFTQTPVRYKHDDQTHYVRFILSPFLHYIVMFLSCYLLHKLVVVRGNLGSEMR